jgi:lipopolysaccharide export system permease protein
MALIDRHIARRLVVLYVAFVAALILVFVTFDYVEHVDDMLDRGARQAEVFRVYYPNLVPEIVRLTSPLALFLACVFLTGRLAQSFQVMALQGAGVSLVRFLVPFLLVGALVTGVQFYVGGYLVPRTQRVVVPFAEKYLDQDDAFDAPQNVFRQNAPGGYLYADLYDRERRMAFGVSLVRYERQALAERVDALQMEWDTVRHRWRLTSPTVVRFTPDGRETRTALPTLDTALNVLPRDLASGARDTEAMTIPETRDYVAAVARTGSGAVDAPRVALYGRYTYPLAHVVLVLLGVPFAVRRQRGGQTVRIALALFVASLYLGVQRIAEPLGANGRLDPLTASVLPHVLFAAAALLALWQARR